MARVSQIRNEAGGAENVTVLEVIQGEQRVFTGNLTTGPSGSPLDLTNYTVSAEVEFGTASVSLTPGARGAPDTTVLTNVVTPADAQPPADPAISFTVSNALAGEVQLVIPSDLEVRNPIADATDGVLIAIVSLTYNDGGTPATIRKNRIVVITRFG